jgi:F420-dependent oxidoreductase-like protein
MRIGAIAGATPGGDPSLDGLAKQIEDLEARGFATAWAANAMSHDAITALAVAGQRTHRIELGTAVVPSYYRHPFAMAQGALTAQAAAGGRFVLGIGLSHKLVIENMLGLSFDKPARHMREYLSVLMPLLRGEPAGFQGELYRVNAGLQIPDAPPVPVIVAALGDLMLGIAGRMADGTLLWMTGPKTIESHIGPKLRSAAAQAGRPEPRIVAGFPIAVTSDPDAARARVGKLLRMYGTLPSYRAMLDREGVEGPGDVALLGDEAALDAELARLRDVGVTDLNAAVFPIEPGSDTRTLDYLQSRL